MKPPREKDDGRLFRAEEFVFFASYEAKMAAFSRQNKNFGGECQMHFAFDSPPFLFAYFNSSAKTSFPFPSESV